MQVEKLEYNNRTVTQNIGIAVDGSYIIAQFVRVDNEPRCEYSLRFESSSLSENKIEALEMLIAEFKKWKAEN